MEDLEKQVDLRVTKWKVVEKTFEDGSLQMEPRTMSKGKWRKKHQILHVVNKTKPVAGIQLRTSSGTFLLCIDNAVLEGMSAELRTAIESCNGTKKKRNAFCRKFLFFCNSCLYAH